MSSGIGNCQERSDKGKQTIEEEWTPYQVPPGGDFHPGPPPDGQRHEGPGHAPMQGQPEDRPPFSGRGVIISGGRDMGPGGPQNMWYFNAESLGKHDPEMYKLIKADMDMERQTRDLAMQYRRATSDERAKLKEQIKELVTKHFAVRQERRALELKRIEADVQRLRESMERRQKAREKLIEQRVSELVGRDEEPTF
jgi:hypothetical protein